VRGPAVALPLVVLAWAAPVSADPMLVPLADPPGAGATPLVAEPPAAPDPVRPRLRYVVVYELPPTVVGTVAWFTSEALKSRLAPATCRWCNPPGVDVAVRGALRWSNTQGADTLSYATGFALAPLAALGVDAAAVYASGGTSREWRDDALVMAEAAVASMDVNQIVKFAVGRERPFVHALPAAAKARTAQPSDNDLSFYSGHTTFAFSSAVSAGTLATMEGYRAAPWIWAGGLTLAAATAYLRIAADRHWFTDVLTGAALGSAVGVVVPLLHRPWCGADRACVTGAFATPIAGGGAVGVRGVVR
jgi:membrane-associated phospholipid phosphatase